jgi:hypothetical protein
MVVAGDTSEALRALDHALDAPRGAGVPLGNWRWSVRQRLVDVRNTLVAETLGSADGRLVERDRSAYRERTELLARLAALVPSVLEGSDPETMRITLKRLAADIARHVQRVRDLVDDDGPGLGGED